MPKQKTAEKEFIPYLDHAPSRKRIFGQIEKVFGDIANFYGFEAIHTSLLEDPKVLSTLARAGMLEDRTPLVCRTGAGVDFSMRPAAIIGILRAYVSHKMNDLQHPLKFLFSEDSLHAGYKTGGMQIRSATEWGLCMIGEEGPIAEAEIVQVMRKGLERIGIEQGNIELRVNATGCNECRAPFRTAFVTHFRPRAHRLCKNCKRHLKRNPTKILYCKEEQCRMLAQNAPQVLDFLCEVCKKHLRGVLEFFDEEKAPYFLDPKFFKDGSVYNTIIFEIIFRSSSPKEEPVEGEQQAQQQPAPIRSKEGVVLAEGGRVSRAGELIVGRKLDAVSGILLLVPLQELVSEKGLLAAEKPKVFLAQLGELAKRKSLGLMESLRIGNITAQESLGRDSVKSQLKVAERVGAEVALILGQKEALDNTIIVREISSGIQETIPQDKLVEFLKRKLKK